MSLFYNFSIFLSGLLILAVSSDYLIKSSVRLAQLLRLTTLFIGLILLAFGTSLPEGSVSIIALIKKYKDIALGNIVGSNIANIGLVLGISGLLRPLKTSRSLFKKEIPIMLISSLFLFWFCADGMISRLEGAVFIAGFILFLILAYRGSKILEEAETVQTFAQPRFFAKANSRFIIFIIFGVCLGCVIFSANLMVNSGVNIAQIFGLSPWIIGLTIFAVGTSLPELAVSVSASLKDVPSISIGNVVGSNIFNILLVLGIVSIIEPITVNRSILTFELPLLIVFSVVLTIFLGTDNRLSRAESLFLLIFYSIFIVLLFIK